MKILTLDFDVTVNENEDWAAEGTVVEIDNSRDWKEDFTGVIITEGFDNHGNKITFNPPIVEIFMNCTFKELR